MVVRKCCKSVERRTKEFLKSSSAQGLKYVWNKHLPKWVQFYFGKVFFVLVCMAINLALNIFNKWQSTPVINGISPTRTSIQDIPFPAITVCSMNKASYSKVVNFRPDSLEYAMLQKTCYLDYNFTRFINTKPRNKQDTYANFIVNVSRKCDEMIVACSFAQTNLPCTDIFREFLVDEGLCCVFNILHPYYLYQRSAPTLRDYTSSKGLTEIAVDWHPISGYPEKLPPGFYPRRGIGIGVENGLQIILNGYTDDYYCSTTNGQGFKVLVYNSIDQPRLKESGLPIMLGHETNYRLVPNSYEAVPDVRSIDWKARHCIFSDERQLLFYKHYSRKNCESECDALYYLKICHCIPYHLPLIYENATVCHVSHFDCLARAEAATVTGERKACGELCLNSCHGVQYFPNPFVTPTVPSTNLAIVNFYHDSNYFRSNVKSSYTGLTEYMSLTGGIMSLMFGFSVVFIAELIYFIFLRPLFEYINGFYNTKVDVLETELYKGN